MKKISYFLFLQLLLLLPITVYAKSLQLDELTILNGELSLPFEPLNNEYTVILENKEYNIELDYKVEENITVSVLDNHDLENNSIVTILLSNEENKTEYHLHVLKEESQTILTFNEETTVTNESFMFQYKMYVIPAVCLFLICINYKILFRKQNKR